jgi:hypothetical protein
MTASLPTSGIQTGRKTATYIIFSTSCQDRFFKWPGSVKLGEHKELAEIPSRDGRFEQTPDHPDGTKSQGDCAMLGNLA